MAPKNKNAPHPAALAIAGSDSGGGAGLQADLKTFAAFRVHGLSVVTCVTAQNPRRVSAVFPIPAKIVRAQLDSLAGQFDLGAIKIGLLFSKENVGAIADFLESAPASPVVLDPVLFAGSGAALLQDGALKILRERLIPRARLLTPNLREVELLAGVMARSVETMRQAARKIRDEFGCAVLIKGGHLKGLDEAADIFWDGQNELLLSARRVCGLRTHGTGCTYASAIAAGLARGLKLPRAVMLGKEFISKAIASSWRVGKHSALNWSS